METTSVSYETVEAFTVLLQKARDTIGLINQAGEYLAHVHEEEISGPVHGARGALISAMSVLNAGIRKAEGR